MMEGRKRGHGLREQPQHIQNSLSMRGDRFLFFWQNQHSSNYRRLGGGVGGRLNFRILGKNDIQTWGGVWQLDDSLSFVDFANKIIKSFDSAIFNVFSRFFGGLLFCLAFRARFLQNNKKR